VKPAYIEVMAGVRYWEDATINGVEDIDGSLTPLKNGHCWCPVIHLEDGRVMDWPAGTAASIHFKICDEGEYWLLDEGKQRIAKWGGHYVPDEFMCPGDNGYGDYIIMNINADGEIQKWAKPAIKFACDCDGEDESQHHWKKLTQEGGAS
jgi:hypothetical protein